MDLDTDERSSEAIGHAELDAVVARAREKLKKLKELPAELRDLVAGGYDACCSKVQEELAEAQANRRAANPLRKRLEGAEAHKCRMEKKLADEKTTLESRKAEMVELRQQIESQKAAGLEAEAAMANATAEVAALAAQFASERVVPPLADVARQVPAGYVSVAFAEEKWAEREAAFAQQVEQLRALVVAQTDAGAATEASQSEAGDLASIESLAFEDDDAWKSVDKGKRKALLRRERDVLAHKVRAGLGKVSHNSSPFKKN